MRLVLPSSLSGVSSPCRPYDPALDDVGSVLRDVCEALETAGVGFKVRIGSSDSWPTTTRTDLLVVMEQLTFVLGALLANQACRLDFCEQGVERLVSLTPKEDAIVVECTDLIKKTSSRIQTMTLPRNVVADELVGLGDDFLRVANICCAELVGHPWFLAWMRELQRNSEKLRSPSFIPRDHPLR
ncbi:MAG: hypothetical protein QM784_40245 [Polyangiaceae bacterium]